MVSRIIDLASGHWPDILSALAGLSSQQLTDEHQPCPLCGGTDRYRFDDKDGTGSWFCNQCGGKDHQGGGGSGMDMLIRKTGWSFAEAAQRLEQYLGITPQSPPPSTAPPIKGAEAVWHYSSTFIVCRFPGKKIRPLSWDGSAWSWKAPPAPRPLYNLAQLTARPTAPVLIVEGEKAADAAAALFPSHIAITWPNGAKATDKTNWSPLANRTCILSPDADPPGQQAMARIRNILLSLNCNISTVQPPPDATDGWDLADALHWSRSESDAWLATAVPDNPQPADNPEPFALLGFDGDAFYYQPTSTGQVLRLSRSSHTGTNLVALAPLSYWATIYPTKTGVDWTAAASDLFQRQAAIGIYSPDLIRGRGAWYDNGRAVLHLGDRLIIDGKIQPITSRIPGSQHLYQRLASIQGPADVQPLNDEEASVIGLIAERFRWEVPASSLLLQGWVTLAPICGALPWRPHAWLTAGAGYGKSAILDRYVAPLLADIGLHVGGNATEAGIRQALRSDARPVVFDEAEGNERKDQERMQSILGLARIASSEGRAQIFKGTPDGDAQRFTVRSMFLLSSIATSLKQGSDRSRFAQLTLRNPSDIPQAEREAHWADLDRDLTRHITESIGRRLQSRTVHLIPIIRQSIIVFTRVAAHRFDSQRLGDQYGTLLAGAWAMRSSLPVTDDQARWLIDNNDWEPYSQTTEIPDERRCLQRILQHQVRVETDDRTCTRSLGELVETAAHRRTDREVTPTQAADAMGRHGLKLQSDPLVLLISNTAEALAGILRETAWNHSWAAVLSRLPGATRLGPQRFSGAGTVSRAVGLPIDSL